MRKIALGVIAVAVAMWVPQLAAARNNITDIAKSAASSEVQVLQATTIGKTALAATKATVIGKMLGPVAATVAVCQLSTLLRSTASVRIIGVDDVCRTLSDAPDWLFTFAAHVHRALSGDAPKVASPKPIPGLPQPEEPGWPTPGVIQWSSPVAHPARPAENNDPAFAPISHASLASFTDGEVTEKDSVGEPANEATEEGSADEEDAWLDDARYPDGNWIDAFVETFARFYGEEQIRKAYQSLYESKLRHKGKWRYQWDELHRRLEQEALVRSHADECRRLASTSRSAVRLAPRMFGQRRLLEQMILEGPTHHGDALPKRFRKTTNALFLSIKNARALAAREYEYLWRCYGIRSSPP